MTVDEMKYVVDLELAEGYRLWSGSGIPLPHDFERDIAVNELVNIYKGPHASELAVACQCFAYFRKLHGMVGVSPAWATLLGDYFFSQFSKNIIPLNSVPLTDAFSEYLKKDVQLPADTSRYAAFIRALPAVLKRCY